MHSHSVYIAEMDKADRSYLVRGLRAHGFVTSAFESGYPLVSMSDNWPDVFLIDIKLPGINGLEVCKWLKSHESSCDIPVILLSPDPYLKVIAASSHADDYIDKPFNLSRIVTGIRECLVSDETKIH
jgi:DNA-binding response OmpR family regulator